MHIISEQMNKLPWTINLSELFFFSAFWRGVYYESKEFAPHGSKFFPFKVNQYSKKGMVCRKATKAVSLVKQFEYLSDVSSPLKYRNIQLQCM